MVNLQAKKYISSQYLNEKYGWWDWLRKLIVTERYPKEVIAITSNEREFAEIY
jgi:hypothetical protein